MYLPTLSPSFKMSPTMGSSAMPIPIKKNMMATSSMASPPLSNSLSPPANTPPNFKMNATSNTNNNNNELMIPAPLIQKNNSEHYYNHDDVKPMDMDGKEDFTNMNSDNDTRNQSKVSIASMLNGDNSNHHHRHHHHHHSNSSNNNNNNYQNIFNNYNALPTPLSTSPSIDQNNNNYYGQNKEDIEAACLLISLRNCEKVC
ncbi:hypothetical protein LY90DRAFT_109460 [Neocallimastix californiae]|uniref:Uncharacterized protein n=1 Tax=Neocallimastix californiae TaxID=1754190 RepID=A0A1Y2ASE8_9FUNG|nr:hypothetical protein LY90DRAFT_109460 [Neocallimastix californiae]|eukprot:ORY25489.1 hypothetical protein LY90DRAFT_109460 [Neocallimastix californiae]